MHAYVYIHVCIHVCVCVRACMCKHLDIFVGNKQEFAEHLRSTGSGAGHGEPHLYSYRLGAYAKA